MATKYSSPEELSALQHLNMRRQWRHYPGSDFLLLLAVKE